MPEGEREESKIENLDETLYSRARYQDPLDKRAKVKSVETPPVAEDWQSPELEEILKHERKEETAPFMKKFFIFAALFFVATLVVAGIVFFGGTNFISSKNVNLTVVGPANASVDQVVELEVTIENDNNADLELANFSVQYPSGARDPSDSSKQMTFTKDSLGVIEAGDQVVRNVRFFLIGQAGETKEIKFSVEYKIKGSKAIFYKDKTYELVIGNSPLSLSIAGPERVSSGEEFTTTVTVALNSTEVLKNVMLRAEYPYGYSVTSATPKTYTENVWALGDISPGKSTEIQIKGRILGENQDQRTIRFYVGAAEGDRPVANFRNIIISRQKTIAVERPAVELKVLLNGERSATYVAPAGLAVNATLNFKNNLPQKLMNPKLEARLSGGVLDEPSILVFNDGFYNSSIDIVNWDLGSELDPGAGGSVSFRFASIQDILNAKGSKEITVEVSLTGTPIGTNSPVIVSETSRVKIASQVTFAGKTLYSIGPFRNEGPIPPKAENETTYTITWSVGNTQNDISDAKVTAQLGPAVKWVNSYSTNPEEITYDEQANTVTWNLGTLASGTGFTTAMREVSFQISLTPSISQVGVTPILVSGASLSGLDTVTQGSVSLTSGALTTQMPQDPQFIQGDGIVVR